MQRKDVLQRVVGHCSLLPEEGPRAAAIQILATSACTYRRIAALAICSWLQTNDTLQSKRHRERCARQTRRGASAAACENKHREHEAMHSFLVPMISTLEMSKFESQTNKRYNSVYDTALYSAFRSLKFQDLDPLFQIQVSETGSVYS